jgi:hypothetical protein
MTSAIIRPLDKYPLRADAHQPHPLIWSDPIFTDLVLLDTSTAWQPGVSDPKPAPNITDNCGTGLDYFELGGKLTVCVLCYGDYFWTQRACLDGILKTIPSDKLDLRITCNACSTQVLEYVRTLSPTALYINEGNIFKYPAMRQMFWDPDHPITTNYVAWFDDNTWVKHLNWLNILADDIHRQSQQVGAYGPRSYRTFKLHQEKDPRGWFQQSSWYRGKDFRSKHGSPIPNGDTIHFCSDWFFVVSAEAIRQCDIPDRRLLQKGGDIVIGEQLYQNGYKIKDFNSAKNLVFTPPAGQGLKRGRKEKFPWQ